MIFADNPHDREIEKMMQKTPHFRPRGRGIFVSEKTEYNLEEEKNTPFSRCELNDLLTVY